ncbi:lipoprotein signal peptidase [Pasteurella canis]|uniref:Lipoprotein signal peptidase n=1 Tax=Pasteurella canis TaxID=753 RepID=A0A379ES24_9PAST|nr:signal peptidase II [Pasteurella canis]SUC03555.1 lipoprotein signal peptidase [Pasteurella canis]
MTQTRTGLSFLWLSVIAFILDLSTKYLVVQNFTLYESINIFPFFNLTYVRNYGAAFSFLAEHSGWQKYLFIILACVISLMLIYFYTKMMSDKNTKQCLCLNYWRALGNMIDRTYHGFVVDFFDFYWDIYHYPVFNVADVAISIGAGLLVLDAFKNRNDRHTSRNKKINKGK